MIRATIETFLIYIRWTSLFCLFRNLIHPYSQCFTGRWYKNASYCASCVRPAQQELVELCPYLFLLSCLDTQRICSYLWNCLLAPISQLGPRSVLFSPPFCAFFVFVQVSCLVCVVCYCCMLIMYKNNIYFCTQTAKQAGDLSKAFDGLLPNESPARIPPAGKHSRIWCYFTYKRIFAFDIRGTLFVFAV